MKITDFSERVQGFYGKYQEEADGDFSLTLKDAGWLWVKITPLNSQAHSSKGEEFPYQNYYEVIMQKTHSSNTRHACIRRLRWKHKILDIFSQWLEINEKSCVRGLAREKITEKVHG